MSLEVEDIQSPARGLVVRIEHAFPSVLLPRFSIERNRREISEQSSIGLINIDTTREGCPA